MTRVPVIMPNIIKSPTGIDQNMTVLDDLGGITNSAENSVIFLVTKQRYYRNRPHRIPSNKYNFVG